MSELIDNARKRLDLLKHMILQLHKGEAPEAIKSQIARIMGEVPYDDIVKVEQELISEGLPQEEVLKLCDIHSEVLKGHITLKGAKIPPPGHPVHTFAKENEALHFEVDSLNKLYEQISNTLNDSDFIKIINQIRVRFNALFDVEKHYLRKENLLFPFLEKHNITGPPTVMWGKHDETRAMLKAGLETLRDTGDNVTKEEMQSIIELVLKPASDSINSMIFKETEILLPMSMDTLTDDEWYSIYNQSLEIGFCLYDPIDVWKPNLSSQAETKFKRSDDRIQLPTGSFTPEELEAIMNTIPFDITFVDKDDTVRYFSHGRERIFARNRAILGRKVQLCHPPSSVHIVEQILEDFHSGFQDRAPFWINLGGQFIHIEYFALKDKEGSYLGCLEVSQNLTKKRKLTGEQRILAYETDKDKFNV